MPTKPTQMDIQNALRILSRVMPSGVAIEFGNGDIINCLLTAKQQHSKFKGMMRTQDIAELLFKNPRKVEPPKNTGTLILYNINNDGSLELATEDIPNPEDFLTISHPFGTVYINKENHAPHYLLGRADLTGRKLYL